MSGGPASSADNPFTADPARVDDRARIPLSVPHLEGGEMAALQRALESNWLGPIGPEVAAFEAEFAEVVDGACTLATTSGTAALHLALRVLGVGPGDDVLVSTLTFCASVNPVLYLGANPVLVDSEPTSWNMDPELLVEELDRRGREDRLPKAVVVVHLFGQLANVEPVLDACDRWGVPLVEDAAEALGARFLTGRLEGRSAGTAGRLSIFSFDASKMITTSMGGMLVADSPTAIEHARKLARQAREPAVHYEHVELGYNYRMSNLLAAFGRVQLSALGRRVAARRAIYDRYREGLRDVEGVELQGEAPWGRHARWLTCVLVDPDTAGLDSQELLQSLKRKGIETRPVWKPMHLQPLYRDRPTPRLGGGVAESLFHRGLCLPSSSSMSPEEVDEVCDAIREAVQRR